MVDLSRDNQRSVAKKERDFIVCARIRRRRCACMRVRSQRGGGAYIKSSSTMTVTGGSSIVGNTASLVRLPAPLSSLSSWLIQIGAIDARSLRNRDFAMLELGRDAVVAHASARRTVEEPI